MVEGKKRVDFNAPESLVREADIVSDLLDTSRTSLLVEGLRKQIDEIVADEGFQHRLREAYYHDRIDLETVTAVLGTEEAMRMKLLRDSFDREPRVSDPDAIDVPSQEEFYDGDLPTWTPDDELGADGLDDTGALTE